jgi:hypothetical protein
MGCVGSFLEPFDFFSYCVQVRTSLEVCIMYVWMGWMEGCIEHTYGTLTYDDDLRNCLFWYYYLRFYPYGGKRREFFLIGRKMIHLWFLLPSSYVVLTVVIFEKKKKKQNFFFDLIYKT